MAASRSGSDLATPVFSYQGEDCGFLTLFAIQKPRGQFARLPSKVFIFCRAWVNVVRFARSLYYGDLVRFAPLRCPRPVPFSVSVGLPSRVCTAPFFPLSYTSRFSIFR